MPVSRIDPPKWKRDGFRSKREYIWSTNFGSGELPPPGYTWGPEGLTFIGYPTRGPGAMPKIPTLADQHKHDRTMTIRRLPVEAAVYLSGDKEFAVTQTMFPGRRACLWELEKIEGSNTGRAFTLAYFPTVRDARAYAFDLPMTAHPPLSDEYRKCWPGLSGEADKYGLIMPGSGPFEVAAFDWIRNDAEYPQYRHRFAHLDPLKHRSDLSKKIFPEGEPEAGYRHAR